MPSLGGAGKGAAIGAGIGSFVPGIGTALGAGIGGLWGLFSGGGDKKDKQDKQRAELMPYLDQLEAMAKNQRQQGSDLADTGTSTLMPAIKYLRNILSANPAEAMAATAPERGRVIDQYDTARKAISEFGPRGGGTTSTLAQSRLSEAGDIADVTNTARREAFGQSAGLGTTLTGLGLSADQLASADLNTILESLLTVQGHDVQRHAGNLQALGGLGQGLGSLLGILLTRPKGAAGG